MKSEKAKDILNDGACHACDEELLDGHWVGCTDLVYCSNAIEAIEVAEQEAEERMRKKAIEAFCDECACFEACICCLPAGACDRKNNFIQKLNE